MRNVIVGVNKPHICKFYYFGYICSDVFSFTDGGNIWIRVDDEGVSIKDMGKPTPLEAYNNYINRVLTKEV